MEPEDVDSILDQANRLLEAGKPRESLECLDAVRGETLSGEDRIEWGSLRAWALSELGRDDEALALLDDLLEEFPQSAHLLGTLGVVLSNNNELDDAREALEEAVALDPRDEVALANLAFVYEKLRDYERALELYDRALALGADIDWILQRKAATLTESGRYAEAKTTLRRYLSLVPDDASQWIALGILHSDDREYREAFECYRQAEKLDPESAALRLNWGVTAVRAGKLRTARRQLTHLKRIEPRSSRWRLLQAFILEEQKRLRTALSIYERVLARRRFADHAELTYAYEMAMDFFARHKLRRRCQRLLAQAYRANACTVELCEAYREATGPHVAEAYWYSFFVEVDYRPGVIELRGRNGASTDTPLRVVRNCQVVARDPDEAVDLVLSFLHRMGETNATLREFVGQEPLEDTYLGLYELEPDGFVSDPPPPDEPSASP